MPDKPATARDYPPGQIELIRATCLYVATRLGDLMDDLVVVGGLVPALLIDQAALGAGVAAHVGTMDLDVGLALGILDDQRYTELTKRLRRAGFSPDKNEQGNPTRQRWKLAHPGNVTVDFLIPPSHEGDRGGTIRHIDTDFAAIIVPGLPLAFRDRRQVLLDGQTILGEKASRSVWVCGPGAYVVLKALAFHRRGEEKDAYDLFYVIRNFGTSVQDVAGCLVPLLEEATAIEAISILERDFIDIAGVGPRRVAAFQTGGIDEALQAEVVGFVADLLARIP